MSYPESFTIVVRWRWAEKPHMGLEGLAHDVYHKPNVVADASELMDNQTYSHACSVIQLTYSVITVELHEYAFDCIL